MTGALVLLIRFVLLVSFCCTRLLFFCPLVFSPYSGPAQFASLLPCLCCPPSPCLSCASFLVLPGGARVFGLSLVPRACCLCWFGAPRCACVGLGVSRVACPPLLCFLPLLFFLPCPACSLFCALVQLTLLCAGASLGVSGCSCDGSVALLSCWVYGPALFSFRHSVHGNKGFLPCVGFFTLYTMLLVTSGSLVRPY